MDFTLQCEPVDGPAALALISCAQDELDRRYGLDDTDRSNLDLDELRPPRGCFVVARDLEGSLSGGVGVRSIGEPAKHFGEIKRLWVRPDLRRGGLALALMDTAESTARKLGLRHLYLETGIKQPEAIAFYQSTGWTLIPDFPDGLAAYPMGLKFTKDL